MGMLGGRLFTGIAEETGKVKSVEQDRLIVAASKVLQEMELGGSMAVNGVCLTITSLSVDSFSVEVMPETLRRTNIGLLSFGDIVNLERPVSLGGRLGGHLVQGHIDATGRLTAIKPEANANILRFEAPSSVMKYIVEKGFIAVDGISLTVTGKEAAFFEVSIVGYTWQNTILGKRRVGDIVNLEADIIAKYVESLSRATGTGVTADFLEQYGFMKS